MANNTCMSMATGANNNTTRIAELLDFEGDELYFAPFPELVGRTYAQVQLAFEKCAVIGVLRDGSVVELNPGPASTFAADDQLIAIVEDDSLFLVDAHVGRAQAARVEPREASDGTRRIVIAGWSSLGPRVIAELDEFLDADTTIELMLDPALVDVDAVRGQV